MALDAATAPSPDGTVTGRAHCLAFVNDTASETALQLGMAEMQQGMDIHRGGIRAAIAAMQRQPTPHVLIVDISAEDSPLAALQTLSDVVEPHVCVLVIGDLTSLDFYREVTRSLGAAEYLARPLSRELVVRHFMPLAQGRAPTGEAALGGRIMSVTGMRGGVGATTIAVNLAWHFGIDARRHTVLLDPDTQFGTASFLLDAEPGTGLGAALQRPDRIDSLLAERAAHPVNDRLHLLASQEPIDAVFEHAPEAAEKLTDALRRRYNFIVADVPLRPMAFYRDLYNMAHRRILVLDPSLASARDALRLMALPNKGAKAKPLLVLNRAGRPGGLPRSRMEEALQTKLDVVIPDLPTQIGNAATYGRPAVAAKGAFRDAIIELTRQVAFSQLLDSAEYRANIGRVQRGWLPRLLRWS